MAQRTQDLDLRKLIRFVPDEGTLWLSESRMLMVHAAAMASMRKELINSAGPDYAKRILTRMGYESGLRDVDVAKKIRPKSSLEDAFAVGPQLHMLAGMVKVSVESLSMDIGAGQFHASARWDNSWEAQAHLDSYGVQREAVCWMLTGYASGYTSGFMGKFILFKEIACLACGASHCQVVGKPIEEWPDGEALAAYYGPESLMIHMLELSGQVEALRSTLRGGPENESLVGSSPAFCAAFGMLKKAASTDVTVLLIGETGVGKERFARALHETGERNGKPFVTVNCAAIPHDLLEAELFGAEKGAYTGAVGTRIGRFERADGGTLFLDEIGELPMAAQAKILRALQESEIERLGSTGPKKVDVRIVAATNVELEEAVRQGRFRADLFYRLNVYPIRVPPLRERQADISPMVNTMLAKFCALHRKRILGLTDSALVALKAYSWPGNVRELENLIERGVILAETDGWIECGLLFPSLPMPSSEVIGVDRGGTVIARSEHGHGQLCETILASGLGIDGIERLLVDDALAKAGGNVSRAARLLGMSRSQLIYRLKHVQVAD